MVNKRQKGIYLYRSMVKNTHSFISLQFYLNSLNEALLLRQESN